MIKRRRLVNVEALDLANFPPRRASRGPQVYEYAYVPEKARRTGGSRMSAPVTLCDEPSGDCIGSAQRGIRLQTMASGGSSRNMRCGTILHPGATLRTEVCPIEATIALA